MREIVDRIFAIVNYMRTKEEGQGLVEYALILVLIAIVCIAALVIVGTGVNDALSTIGSAVTDPIGS